MFWTLNRAGIATISMILAAGMLPTEVAARLVQRYRAVPSAAYVRCLPTNAIPFLASVRIFAALTTPACLTRISTSSASLQT
jgi:hypothetical protein